MFVVAREFDIIVMRAKVQRRQVCYTAENSILWTVGLSVTYISVKGQRKKPSTVNIALAITLVA